MENSEWLDRFEKVLEDGLLKVCSGEGLVDAELLRSPDVDAKWEDYIKDYVADAVENINEFPEAAIAWAAFLGMGVAYNWDLNWRLHHKDAYSDYYGSRGWDDMDEHILRDLLGLPLDGDEARKISSVLQSCAVATLGLFRHEQVATDTSLGFYALSRAYTVMYRIGAGIELKRLKYRKVAINA